ncbi:MAG TPA: amidohydrolase, partial [Bacteroidales bacterium]|nr:amidohydrolase [Bacteroidales bacterium]
MSLLIKNVTVGNDIQDIAITENKIDAIQKNITGNYDKIIDGADKLALPGFYNTHTHAGMTLLRGYSDDLPVMQWLQEKIWPLEEKLTGEDVYIGTKLACLEMIKTGTVFFNDMYWHFDGIAQAVTEMGIRATINSVVIDLNDKKNFKKQQANILAEFEKSKDTSSRIQYAIGTHSIYTVSEYALKWCADFAQKHDLILHIHVSETEHEVYECVKHHNMRPVEYLDKIGFLGPNVMAAHCIWLNKKEIEILKSRQVMISHIPTSNMKLSSGIFPYKEFTDYIHNITLGTDGCASNNNLDMGEEMKFASCKAKLDSMDPTLMGAEESMRIATENGARAFGLNAGKIAEGKLADLVLVDLNNHLMVPA